MVHLISIPDFAGRCDLSGNIDEKYINPHILKAQEQFLKPLIGTDFYSSLLDQFESGYFSNAEIETMFNEYLKPYLIYLSYSLYLPHSKAFMTGYGPVVMTESNSEQISDRLLSIMADEARNSYQFWQAELIRYICDNISSFELYANSEDRNTRKSGPSITGIKTKSRNDRTNMGEKRYYNTWNND